MCDPPGHDRRPQWSAGHVRCSGSVLAASHCVRLLSFSPSSDLGIMMTMSDGSDQEDADAKD